MKSIWKSASGALLLLALLPDARAAITCDVSTPAITMYYREQSTAKTQATVTVGCTRTNGGDPTSVNYSVTADNGDYAQGTVNRARRTVLWIFQSNVSYELYTNSSCATPWNAPTALTGTITWPGGATGRRTQDHSFWICIPQQAVGIDGLHQDSVQLTASYNYQGTRYAYGTLGMNVITPASCAISTPPGDLVLNYPAFSPTPVWAETTVGMRCTAQMPYTLEILPPADVLSGVRYGVAVTPDTGTGNGNTTVNHTIRATAPAGQPGQCGTGSCQQTRTHEVRITY